MSTTIQRAATRIAILLLGILSAGAARGQYRDEPYSDDIRQTVARVSYLSGPVSYARGDEPDDWQSADVNVPLTIGDRLYTGRGGRAELQIQGAVVRLSADTDLAALNLTDDTKQLSLTSGTAAFQVRRLADDEVFEVDTPNAAVTFERPGDYRVDVDRDGNTRVRVRRGGQGTVAAGGGQVPLSSGEEMAIDGIDDPRYDVFALSAADAFDRWVASRRSRSSRSPSFQYVSDDVVGAADLDEYGRWEDIPEYGHVWSPASVEAGWTPYRVGHWVWQDPWGWTWVSGEPWGWAPYHYGRWVNASSRWYWVPEARSVRAVRYSPALVGFVGGGPGFSASIGSGGGGFVGWFPLAPRDPYVPWWGSRGSRRADARDGRDVRYVNRNHVTVVNQNAFVSGGLVTRNAVTDRNVLQPGRERARRPGSAALRPDQRLASGRRADRPSSAPAASRRDREPAGRRPHRAASRAARLHDQDRHDPPESGRAGRLPAEAARIVEQRKAPAAAAIRPVVTEPGRMTLTRGREAGRANQGSPQTRPPRKPGPAGPGSRTRAAGPRPSACDDGSARRRTRRGKARRATPAAPEAPAPCRRPPARAGPCSLLRCQRGRAPIEPGRSRPQEIVPVPAFVRLPVARPAAGSARPRDGPRPAARRAGPAADAAESPATD